MKMRREFILVMLGIICISMLSSLFSNYVHVKSNKALLERLIGSVGAGNWSYWHIGHYGPLLIELTSVTGDADMYIADHYKPGYEVDENHFSSITCGQDIIYIPSTYARPLGIGVFGHWSSAVSDYIIQIFMDTSVELTELEMRSVYRGPRIHYDKTETEKRNKEKSQTDDEESKPRFLKFLGIVDMIFEMFLM